MVYGIREVLEGLVWFFSWVGFVIGVGSGTAVGVTLFFCSASAYRRHRRWMLHRQWRRDEPMEVDSSPFTPAWDEYDPDDETADSRCVCHGRKILPGERVLFWPQVGPFRTLYTAVYCDKVKESV